MFKRLHATLFIAMVAFTSTPIAAQDKQPRILAIGDSMLAAHRISGRAVSNYVERAKGMQVKDNSVLGARIIYNLPITGSLGLNIGKQYRKGDWDWVIMNGGGNDLWLGCGCSRCDRKLNKLAAKNGNGAGAIPKLIKKIRKTGAKVIYVGYLRSPGAGSPIEHCRNEGDELERRMKAFAKTDSGVFHVSVRDLVPHGDRSFHGADMIHPSIKGSREIGKRIARVIKTK
ncbi:SGNH/GDSL hydrolase family protein [Amylibacter sp. IMCC11727]|uniref:SGNH/GDSL hydrolase family protein n=1 Tax=Amylibacter sp. IMCC11727 TaxID=3039851 RepID=UPI00244DC155|nr:SGNH/GDSL hydrolase family protein [Amylibacter sp. IMCC11727]WGI21843.1 SGNH/GDSL hydrolase family protein [Amylibacter sp. IMCC11727]